MPTQKSVYRLGWDRRFPRWHAATGATSLFPTRKPLRLYPQVKTPYRTPYTRSHTDLGTRSYPWLKHTSRKRLYKLLHRHELTILWYGCIAHWLLRLWPISPREYDPFNVKGSSVSTYLFPLGSKHSFALSTTDKTFGSLVKRINPLRILFLLLVRTV